MDKRKKLFSKTDPQVHTRSKYTDHSRRFLDFVDSLGFEQTLPGRFLKWIEERFNVRAWFLLFFFCLILSSIIFYDVEYYYEVQLGEVAAVDIKSPLSFEIVDEAATEEKRKSAEGSVPPIFDYDTGAYEQVINRVYKSFRKMRKEVKSINWPLNEVRREESVKEFAQNFKMLFEKDLNVEVPARIFEWITDNKFSIRIENILIRSLMRWSAKKITDGQGSIVMRTDEKLLARPVGPSRGDEYTIHREDILDLKKAGEFEFEETDGASRMDTRDRKNVLDIARLLLVANLTYNRQETSDRRQKSKDSVPPIVISVKKNQLIVDKGTVIQPAHITLVNEINSLKNPRRTDFVTVVVAFLFFILISVFYSYLRGGKTKKFNIYAKDVYAMGSVILLIVILLKGYMFVADQAFNRQAAIPAGSLLFAAPVAAGPMLVGLMVSFGEVVWLFTIFLSITLAFTVSASFDPIFLLVTAIGGIAAARGVQSCQKRNDIYKAGVRTGLVSALVLAAVTFLQPKGDHTLATLLIWNIPLGMVGGLLAAMLTMALIPAFESVFNYTTDVKLLELSSLNHHLMKDMIVKAPGTYHHSLVVGSMCEAAAEEIGCNPLLAKVMAYYHDIGKMEHSHYFIENQRQGNNPHDHISPNMSKTVLIAHVKDGAEMGIKAKLGKEIIDGILQHHGTTLINYFYNKALEGQDAEIDMVNEEDFRYPGPKPQFKEAALLMIADSIEAAARAIDEPTAGRLTTLVKNIIQNKFIDGQLDQCDLTLRDLGVIEECYRRVILGIYHQRIDYPQTPPRQPAQLPPAYSTQHNPSMRTVKQKKGPTQV